MKYKKNKNKLFGIDIQSEDKVADSVQSKPTYIDDKYKLYREEHPPSSLLNSLASVKEEDQKLGSVDDAFKQVAIQNVKHISSNSQDGLSGNINQVKQEGSAKSNESLLQEALGKSLKS